MSLPDSKPIKPIFAVGGLYSRANGIAWIMRDLAAALGRAGSPVDVYAADAYGRGAAAIGDIFDSPTRWRTANGLWLGGLSWAPRLKAMLRKVIDDVDVVHSHSTWMLPTSYATRIALNAGKPALFTCHGMLTPWALKNSGWKKQIVGRMFQFRDLEMSSCLHVNSLPEMEGIRELGYRNPVAVIPNGVHLPDFDNLPQRSVFDQHVPTAKGKRIALFMGRLHKKKGLDTLVEAWKTLASEHPDWHLIVAGPDDGLLSHCESFVAANSLQQDITFTGNLQSDMKKAALSAAEIFTLPSHSEGFSMALIEAMACELPVLLTPGCNFPEASAAGAAVETQPSLQGTLDGMRQLMTLSPSEILAMGKRGRQLIEANYTWDGVAQQTLEMYRWLRHGDTKPKFVHD